MKYYQDITLLPDGEIDIAFIRNKSYDKLHKAMFDLNSTDIGISFPEAKEKLGCVIRIHSTKESLEKLQALNWMNGLSDYCKLSDILPIPKDIKGYQNISRIRQTMNIAKLNKQVERAEKKGEKTQNEIDAYIKQYKAKMFATSLNNPYLELKSASTNNRYRIYLKFEEIQEKEIREEFNNFGLSKTATIPIF